jgi:hypothetical protein
MLSGLPIPFAVREGSIHHCRKVALFVKEISLRKFAEFLENTLVHEANGFMLSTRHDGMLEYWKSVEGQSP